MSKVDDLIMRLCPRGVEHKNLGDVATYTRGITYSKNDEQVDGPIKVLRANNINLSTHTLLFDDIKTVKDTVRVRDNQQLHKNDILISAASGSKAHVGKVAYVYEDIDYCFGGFMAVLRTENTLNSRFLFHLLVGDSFNRYLDSNLASTTINNLSSSIMNAYKIPVPPIEIQKEIVNILDKFTQLEAELEAELEARKKQYEYYRRYLFEMGGKVTSIKLSDACLKITTGKLNANAKDEGGLYPFFTCDATPYRINTFAFDTEAILVSGNGSQVGHINYYNGKFNAYQRTYVLTNFSKDIAVDYLLLFLNAYLRDYIFKHSKKGSVPYITLPMLQNFDIPLPDKSSQLKIAKALGEFDILVNNISIGLPAEINARRKQYEYYRDKLLTFEELKV